MSETKTWLPIALIGVGMWVVHFVEGLWHRFQAYLLKKHLEKERAYVKRK